MKVVVANSTVHYEQVQTWNETYNNSTNILEVLTTGPDLWDEEMNDPAAEHLLEQKRDNDDDVIDDFRRPMLQYLRTKPPRSQSGRYGVQVRPGDMPHHVLIFKLTNKKMQKFRAFCAGSIITNQRVLSSANCFLTNRKRDRHDYSMIRVAAGALKTQIINPNDTEKQQWRRIIKVFSQRRYRFPAFNLAILVMDKDWEFNEYINSIPFESQPHDFDGVCVSTAVKATRSWSTIKYVYTEEVQMIQRKQCEKILQRSCVNYFCTEFDNRNKYAFSETEGGGLVCYGTGDPEEIDENQGLLVGVTSIINIGLPSLHMRIGNYAKWVVDKCCTLYIDVYLLLFCLVLSVLNTSIKHYIILY